MTFEPSITCKRNFIWAIFLQKMKASHSDFLLVLPATGNIKSSRMTPGMTEIMSLGDVVLPDSLGLGGDPVAFNGWATLSGQFARKITARLPWSQVWSTIDRHLFLEWSGHSMRTIPLT